MTRKKIVKSIIDNNCIEACKATFATTDRNVLMGNSIDISATNISDYIKFTSEASCSARTIWFNLNNKPWMTKNIKDTIKKLYQAESLDDNSEQCKIIRCRINNLIKETKLHYESRTLDKMSENMKQPGKVSKLCLTWIY